MRVAFAKSLRGIFVSTMITHVSVCRFAIGPSPDLRASMQCLAPLLSGVLCLRLRSR